MRLVIGDVRGRGLMLGVEFVTDRDLKTPAKSETLHLMDQMKEMGVLVGKGGFYGNVFRITPPLCFTLPDAVDKYNMHILYDYNLKPWGKGETVGHQGRGDGRCGGEGRRRMSRELS
ncbi:hypothetical protein YC2023_029946 [Brassica napus]